MKTRTFNLDILKQLDFWGCILIIVSFPLPWMIRRYGIVLDQSISESPIATTMIYAVPIFGLGAVLTAFSGMVLSKFLTVLCIVATLGSLRLLEVQYGFNNFSHLLAIGGYGMLVGAALAIIGVTLSIIKGAISALPASNAMPRHIAVGALIGLIVGYPLSYFFQSGALRAKVSLGTYIEHISDVLSGADTRGTAVIVWIGCVVVLALTGWGLSGMVKSPSKQNDANEITR